MPSENQETNSKAGFSGEEAKGCLGLVACGGMPGSMSKPPLLSGASWWSLKLCWPWQCPSAVSHQGHLWPKGSTAALLSGKDVAVLLPAPLSRSEKNNVVTSEVVLAVGFQTPCGARAFFWPMEVLGVLSETKVMYWGFLHCWAFLKVSKFKS